MKKNLLYKCLLLAFAGTAVTVQAQDKKSRGTADTDVAQLGTVTIIGNQINAVDDTLPNVDVIQVSTLQEIDVNSIQSALKRNTAIEVNTTQRQPQLYLRGMGENYTEITLDGQHLPEFFAFGPFSSGGRDFIETDTLKQIDIIKGLHSPKQKAGALAGTVNLRTYDPSDLVSAEKPTYFSLKTGYTSKDRGIGSTVMLAGGKDTLKGMLIYTRRDYHEPKNMGNDATKTRRAKQDVAQNNLLAKGELNLENAKILLTGEVFDRDLKRTNRYPRRPGADKPTDNPTKRSRLALESEFYNLVNLDSVKVGTSILNYQQTDNQSGFGTHHFKQKNFNFHIDAEKQISTGSIEHNLLFGMAYDINDFDYDRTSSRGGAYRFIPKTKRKKIATYIKDQMVFNNGMTLAPGVRVERQKLDSTVDASYLANPALDAQEGYVPKGNLTSVTPTLNVTFPVSEDAQVFASYARGVKTPDISNLGGFDHGFGFIIPNPDLETEKSNSFELGFNYTLPEKMEFKLTGFYNRFKNFVDFKNDGTRGTTPQGTPKSILRPFNVKNAKTYGAELELGYHLTPQWYAHAALAYMRGSFGVDQSHGVALSKAYPKKAILGLSYDNDHWGGNLDWTLVGKGQETAREDGFRTPGYGVVDATAWFKPTKGMTVTAGVYNLLDKKYFISADVNGAKASQVTDAYTQPGRNFGINLNYEF